MTLWRMGRLTARVIIAIVAASTKPMTLWRRRPYGSIATRSRRGIHEANDLVAECYYFVPCPRCGVAASTKPMTLWRHGRRGDFEVTLGRGIHEANDLVAGNPALHTAIRDKVAASTKPMTLWRKHVVIKELKTDVSRHPRSQ